MYLVFEMHNCTGGVNQNCIAAYPGEEWKCFMAQVSNVPMQWLYLLLPTKTI